jgi:hypothetical protein
MFFIVKNHWEPYFMDNLRITKLCRQQAEDIQNHGNADVRNIGQGEAQH